MFVRIKVDLQHEAAKSFLEFAKNLSFVTIEEDSNGSEKLQSKNSKFRPLPPPTTSFFPHIKADKMFTVFQVLKDFFPPEQLPALKKLLETGQNSGKGKLLFLDNVNRLADTFKKLFEHDVITGCKKQDLQAWIVANFQFMHKGNGADISETTIERYISSVNGDVYCKRQLINIVDGHIVKA